LEKFFLIYHDLKIPLSKFKNQREKLFNAITMGQRENESMKCMIRISESISLSPKDLVNVSLLGHINCLITLFVIKIHCSQLVGDDNVLGTGFL
jgi:hypothetical protein